jgi:hypothetical protein
MTTAGLLLQFVACAVLIARAPASCRAEAPTAWRRPTDGPAGGWASRCSPQ